MAKTAFGSPIVKRYARMWPRKVCTAAVAIVFLAGCATTEIYMKNPRTEQIFICKEDLYDGSMSSTARACAEALKRDGWQELGRN